MKLPDLLRSALRALFSAKTPTGRHNPANVDKADPTQPIVIPAELRQAARGVARAPHPEARTFPPVPGTQPTGKTNTWARWQQ